MKATFDAIVIGTGISGGWAAKELCEAGLKTLVLEKGRMLQHGEYPTASLDPWELPNDGQLTRAEIKEYPHQFQCRFMNQANKHYFVKDADFPYHQQLPFDWIRGNQVGGRSLVWARQVYRWSDLDFAANQKEEIAVDWPIRYKDIAPWYSYVEKFIGVSGRKDGLAHLPDGEFLPAMEMTAIEKYFEQKMAAHYLDRIATIGRTANLTQDHLGRGKCQYRNRCSRGCPYGAYFSSVSSTLPAAEVTGNMTLKADQAVVRILYDQDTQKALGVETLDTQSGEMARYNARIIFLNASTLGSTKILLQSDSSRFPDGMGNDSGQLGKNLMDHHCYAGAIGYTDILQDRYYSGRRPNVLYVPRFQNLGRNEPRSYLRGFNYQGQGDREGWLRPIPEASYGAAFKEACFTPGRWRVGLLGFGEMLPDENNQVSLHSEKKDETGLPQLSFRVRWGPNELAMRQDMMKEAKEMLEVAGMEDIQTFDDGDNPGAEAHEMGTARMGHDPATSVLNKWNQIHAVKNVFVTDGACMTSSACQNPSLTYMALTARAAQYAIGQLKKMEL